MIDGLTELAGERGQTLRDFLRQVDVIVHGTTVTTNAVLTARTARTGLVTTSRVSRCPRDAARNSRKAVRQQVHGAEAAGAAHAAACGVGSGQTAEGTIVTALDLDDVEQAARVLRREKVEAIAVCFMHAYANARQ